MNALEVLQKQKIIQRHIVEADSSGRLPSRIEILRAGEWPDTSTKGKLKITVGDLYEMKSNFDRGIGVPGQGQTGLPVDFMHEEWDKAAAWIKSLEIENEIMFASVEWSKAGEEAVLNKEFKCVSPSFYPACLGTWTDPENADNTARNVLVGAGLTNIPFFKDLKPIMASNTSKSSEEDKNIIYIASEKETNMPTLDEVRVKDVPANEEEKKLLVEANNKGELTREEQEKFGFEVTKKEGEKVDATKIDADTKAKIEAAAVEAYKKQVEADLKKDGKVVVEASRIEALEASAKDYETKKAEQFVDAHIGRGAIKADQRDTWVDRLVNASTADRELFENTLKDLPDNEAMNGKKGDDAGVDATASQLIEQKAKALVEAAVKESKTLDIGAAMSQVMASEPDLAKRYNEEQKG